MPLSNDQDEQRKRFDERRRLNDRIAEETIAELVSVTRSATSPAAESWDEEPLLSAARRVAGACGIAFRVPGIWLKSRNPLESILDASGARSRRVLLKGRWWTRELGPMLAYRAETNEPLALLPDPSRWFRRPRYRAVSHNGESVRVNASVAATLDPHAETFYAPLPNVSSAFSLLRIALRSRRREITIALLCGLGVTLLGMLTPQATRILLEYAVPDADRTILFHIGAALVAAAAGALLFDLVQAVAILRTVTATSTTLQTGLWDRLLRQSPAFFRDFTSGDLENRANAVTHARFAMDETAIKTILGSTVGLLNLFLLFYYSATLALVALVVASIALAVHAAGGYLMFKIVTPLQESEGELGGLLIQLLNATSKLRIAGAEGRAFAQWARAYTRKQRLKQRLQVLIDRVHLVSILLPPLSTAAIFWFAFASFSNDGTSRLSLGSFVAFNAAFGSFLASAMSLGDSSSKLLSVAATWKRMGPILEGEPEGHLSRNSPGELRGGVRVDHATFRYRDDGPLTLSDVSIHAEPGECIAIVGPSGSGKSTLINLLLRFETPDSGAVYYDGHDLSSLNVLEVRRQLGVVTQENRILAGSIYDNIVCGGLSTMDDAWAAARAAGFEDDIRQMPMGMHTFMSEGGGNISGGQRQRLLIARALVQKPRIVILDEATSALDNRTQAIVTESLNNLDVTLILVAHRLSTVRRADRIYVLEAGRVVQEGGFDDLMQQEGLFARLMQRQMI